MSLTCACYLLPAPGDHNHKSGSRKLNIPAGSLAFRSNQDWEGTNVETIYSEEI